MNAQVDTLKLALRLEAGGFSTDQARTMASALGDAASDAEVATRTDLTLLEQRLTIKLGVMLVVAIGATSTIVHFWH